MRSKHTSWCHICRDAIDTDVEIARCNGLWVHWGCRELVRMIFSKT